MENQALLGAAVLVALLFLGWLDDLGDPKEEKCRKQ
jgi:hypothetical protein